METDVNSGCCVNTEEESFTHLVRVYAHGGGGAQGSFLERMVSNICVVMCRISVNR